MIALKYQCTKKGECSIGLFFTDILVLSIGCIMFDKKWHGITIYAYNGIVYVIWYLVTSIQQTFRTIVVSVNRTTRLRVNLSYEYTDHTQRKIFWWGESFTKVLYFCGGLRKLVNNEVAYFRMHPWNTCSVCFIQSSWTSLLVFLRWLISMTKILSDDIRIGVIFQLCIFLFFSFFFFVIRGWFLSWRVDRLQQF